ncbi:MAG: hypothetical protein EOP00_07770 [Pedobacter sp.]|nr:MAG: hypothetical protein EOP00_07770 [Pedobacter sp.]
MNQNPKEPSINGLFMETKLKTFLVFIPFLFIASCTEHKKVNQIEDSSASKGTAANNNPADTIEVEQAINKPTTLFEIEGNYIVESNDSDCKMNLKLYYRNKQWYYQLITHTRKLADEAKIELNEKKDGYYITFNNIEWSENDGALDENNEQIDKEVALPTSVQGVMYKNEITIQNTGNAMNYYVKIGECDLKYIRLIKKSS